MRSILSSTAANTGREENFSNRLLKNGSTGSVVDHKTNRKSIWWSGEIHRNTSCVIRQNSFASLLWTCTLFTILIEVWKRKNGRFPCCVFIFFILYTYICHERLSLKCHKLHWTRNTDSWYICIFSGCNRKHLRVSVAQHFPSASPTSCPCRHHLSSTNILVISKRRRLHSPKIWNWSHITRKDQSIVRTNLSWFSWLQPQLLYYRL